MDYFAEEKKKMLKKKLGIISTLLATFLLLAPAASRAMPAWSTLSRADVASSSLGHWWDLLTGSVRGHAPAQRTIKPKNGCGIDPQGQPVCIQNPGGPTQGTTPPPPGDGSGS